jgi:periplasmic protein CpxP/Spy
LIWKVLREFQIADGRFQIWIVLFGDGLFCLPTIFALLPMRNPKSAIPTSLVTARLLPVSTNSEGSPKLEQGKLGVRRQTMTKPRIKTLAIATLSAIALAASIAVAQSVSTGQDNAQGPRKEWRGRGRGERGEHSWGGMQGGAFRQLNLTDDQKAKMKQIREGFAERNKPLHEQLHAKRQELHQASEGGTFNEALATQKLTEMASLEAKLMGEQFKMHQEMLSVLTAEQKAQLEQSKAQFKAQRGERRGGEKE